MFTQVLIKDSELAVIKAYQGQERPIKKEWTICEELGYHLSILQRREAGLLWGNICRQPRAQDTESI